MRKAPFLLFAVLAGNALALAQQKVVDPSKLQQLLPTKDLPGFKRKPPTGSIDTTPFGRLSSAEVNYETPGEVPRIVQVSIKDFAEHIYARALLLELTREEGRQETQEGYTKSVVIKGKYRGKETGNRLMSGNEVKFVVADRFLVTVGGTRIPDIGTLYSLIDAMDLPDLEKLR
ncbi:MAG: hypothetical protein LAO07_21445 [Acidobacteriia bacterium]|nr:hypothetical protein [Terriglobia bacterium]